MDLSVAVFVFAAVWYTRYRYDRPGTATDLILVALLWIGIPRSGPLQNQPAWRWRSHLISKGYCCFYCACYVGLSFLTIYLGIRAYQKYQENDSETEAFDAEIKSAQSDLDKSWYARQYDFSPLKPILFPCRTSHTRIFPKKHSFSYSYLFVGIPVGWRGRISSLLTADLKTLPWKGRKPKIGWFSVDSGDYLARGDSMHGLRGKLDNYLKSQVSASYMSHVHTRLWF